MKINIGNNSIPSHRLKFLSGTLKKKKEKKNKLNLF